MFTRGQICHNTYDEFVFPSFSYIYQSDGAGGDVSVYQFRVGDTQEEVSRALVCLRSFEWKCSRGGFTSIIYMFNEKDRVDMLNEMDPKVAVT